ncbi:hypothetical protein B0T16DRAFT_205135 [Cercophora newfieldiana]|uniref:Uncharacterized protein n=1 Tax=Cercophora newfieldiana TaxID=92897 RepID=A0AA39XVD6_9PEZI|nr:hypothetical protein B0T16DRAFT_205135 [Cercophora newfieldiana]
MASREPSESRRKSRSRSPRAGGERRDRERGEREKYRERDSEKDRRRERSRDRERDRASERDEEHRHHRHRENRQEAESRPDDRHEGRHESRNHHHHHHRSHRDRDDHRKSKESKPEPKPKKLPYSARKLTNADLPVFRPLFAHYLELQKNLLIDNLDDTEVRGRWKSFMGKWNRGELAEGWYEPELFERVSTAAEGAVGEAGDVETAAGRPGEGVESPRGDSGKGTDVDDDDDDGYGPVLPGAASSISKLRGPGVPSLQDLDLRREMNAEEKEARIKELRDARKVDRRMQKERLDELVPRADAGTRERRLEKRKEVNEKMKAFREPSPGDEVPEEDLVGVGGGIADYKRMLAEEKQKVSERQQRREEMERARNAERDERIKAYREREEGTIEKLRELARQRFG